MARPHSKKSKVFNLPARNPYSVRPTGIVEQPAQPRATLAFEVSDAECAYTVGAFLDAEQKAQDAQARCEAAGDLTQAAVYREKAKAMRDLATRVARAFTSNSR